MKVIFSVALVFSFISGQAFASRSTSNLQKLTCVNEAHSAITFALSIAGEKGQVQFGDTGDQSAIEKDLIGQKINLALDKDDSANGYIHYWGMLLANSYAQEYREIEIRFAKSELAKTSGIRVIMSPSNSFYLGSYGSTFQQYGMKCERTQ